MSRKMSLLVLLILVAGIEARAQTISPVIVEYQGKASGRFQVMNDSDVPLAVVLEPESFKVDSQGQPTFFPLDPNVHLELSTTSFRLAAHQTYIVFYKASAASLPAWFTIYATITGKRTTQGIELAIHLPHTVYLLGKTPLESRAVVWDKATFLATENKIEGQVSNVGPDYGRVVEVTVTAASGKKEQYTGFPLFPGQHRHFELPWKSSGVPQSIELKFHHFVSDTPIQMPSAAK